MLFGERLRGDPFSCNSIQFDASLPGALKNWLLLCNWGLGYVGSNLCAHTCGCGVPLTAPNGCDFEGSFCGWKTMTWQRTQQGGGFGGWHFQVLVNKIGRFYRIFDFCFLFFLGWFDILIAFSRISVQVLPARGLDPAVLPKVPAMCLWKPVSLNCTPWVFSWVFWEVLPVFLEPQKTYVGGDGWFC